ncbi:TadE/TadG family type IV pilus assembly protein [Microlunatus soli]|uniref:TadE-like protein n=1 Tax=Microlunatus soli TaxID=630515 RepID=A0A1H1UNM8_9ACTN|nr:TadE/TadG family type IV pilus assembly protein [Microlunatus soli]SDS74142.1 TadE-like protein [Microlunatus soli]
MTQISPSRITGTRVSHTRRDERGLSPGIELVVLLPALLLLVGVTVAGGRLWFTRSAVTEAAYSAARAASLERSAAPARTAGRDAATAQLRTDGVRCSERAISLDTGDFAAEVGEPGAVVAEVRCRIGFGDIAVPGLPGTMLITGSASAPIDTYRER